MEIFGKLHEVSEVVEVKRKDGEIVRDRSGRVMQKQGFAVKLKSQKEQYAYFETLNNDVIRFIADTKIGTPLRVRYGATSRKWNDKWFTSLTAFEAEVFYAEDIEIKFNDKNTKQDMGDAMAQGRRQKDFSDLNEHEDDLPF